MQTGKRNTIKDQSAPLDQTEDSRERRDKRFCGLLTSIAVLRVWTLTAADSYKPWSFMSTTLPVSPSTPNECSPAACFACALAGVRDEVSNQSP
jgi:hypothetical protein